MSVEIARRCVEHTASYTDGIKLEGLHRERLDAWVALIHSGTLSQRLSDETPELPRVITLCNEISNTFYNTMKWVFHVGQAELGSVQKSVDQALDKADEVKALIEATPLPRENEPEDDVEEDDGCEENGENDYGEGISDDCYGVTVAEEGYTSKS